MKVFTRLVFTLLSLASNSITSVLLLPSQGLCLCSLHWTIPNEVLGAATTVTLLVCLLRALMLTLSNRNSTPVAF